MAKEPNPALRNIIKQYSPNGNPANGNFQTNGFQGMNMGAQAYGYQQGYQQAPYPTKQATQDRPMTIDDVVTKTSMTIGLTIVFAVIVYVLALTQGAGIASIASTIGGIAGLGIILFSTFTRRYDSAPLTLAYGAAEGIFVGGFTFIINQWVEGATSNFTDSGTGIPMIAFEAVLGTFGVFVAMLIAYKSKIIRVTPKFQKILFMALIGILFVSVGSWVMSLFTHSNPLAGGGMWSILFSLVCIVVAALTLVQDFDQADRLIQAGAPSKAAWGVALGLTVSLVWLYIQFLQLLSSIQRD